MNPIKKKKPKFKRRNFILSKLKDAWRRPRGIHNKLRLNKAGHQKKPCIGYKNQKEVRGLFASKFPFTKVSNLKDLEKAKDNILLSNIGANKKIKIIEKALELNLNILNIKNPKDCISKIKQEIEERKKHRKKKFHKKEEIKKEEKSHAEKKLQKEQEETKEEKEEREKEEKRKVLEGKKK